MEDAIFEAVVPNHSPAYLLRISLERVQQLPIVAWHIQKDPGFQERVFTFPLSVGEMPSNVLDCVVVSLDYIILPGDWPDGGDRIFFTSEAAVAECRTMLGVK